METFANIDMEDYWNEYRTVRGRRTELRGSHSEEDSRSHEDDVDSDETFLESVLLDHLKQGKEIEETDLTESRLFSTLNSRQKDQLLRRAEARNVTLRQKRLKTKDQKPKVWSVFSSNNDNSSTGTRSRSATPDSLDSISPPRTPPDPSPKNWIDSHLSRSRASLDSGHHSLITSGSAFTPIYPTPSLSPTLGEDPKNPSANRSFSPPTIVDKYYYGNDRGIYRAPSLDILKEREPVGPKDATVRRQKSYTRDLARDVRHYYSNKGVYEINPSYLTDQLEEIQGLRYEPIGSLHYKSISRNKKSILPQDPQTQLRKSTLTRSHSSVIKDPFIQDDSVDPIWDEGIGRTTRPNSSSCDLGFKIVFTGKDEEFPDLVLESSRSGRTKVDWLHQSDLDKLTSLSLLELDILFSENHIAHSWTKRHRKRRSKEIDSGVFGASLETLLEKDRIFLPDPFLETNVPLVIHKLIKQLEIRGLREEGILRVPGNRAKTEEFRKKLDETFYTSPQTADEILRQALPNEIAGLIKQFLRELPQPLLTHQYTIAFYKTHKIPELGERVLGLTMLILLLPPFYRDTLKTILDLCTKIVSLEKHNRMGLYNVAMIMAPNVFLPTFHSKLKSAIKSDSGQIAHEKEYAHVTTNIMQTLIKYKEIIWTVPHRLVAQIRRQFEHTTKPSNNKALHRLLARKNKDLIQRPITNEVDFQNGVMRITATQFNKINHPVKLTWHMTAKDIIQRFIEDQSSPGDNHRVVGRREQIQHKNQPNIGMTTCLLRGSLKYALITHALHEKGGNIGERRIDHNAELIAVYQDNPNGEFFVKCHHPGGQF